MEFNRKTTVYGTLAAVAFVGLVGGASYMGAKLASPKNVIVSNNTTDIVDDTTSTNTAAVGDSDSSQTSSADDIKFPPIPSVSYDRIPKAKQDAIALEMEQEGYSPVDTKIVIDYYADRPEVSYSISAVEDVLNQYYTALEAGLPDQRSLTKNQKKKVLEAHGVSASEADEWLQRDHDDDIYRVGPNDVSQSNGRWEAAQELKHNQ